ncbi:MAG: methyl-accepting chemotaxis protein [Gammaproteobacteria bacterium]
MNFFNFKISHKLGALVLISLLGFAVIGTVYYRVLQLEGAAQEATVTAQNVVFGIDALNSQLLTAERLANDFFNTKDQSSQDGFKVAMSGSDEQFAALRQLNLEEDEQARLVPLQAAAVKLVSTFDDAAALQAELGLDENSGIQGQMRSVIHNLEVALATAQENLLNASFSDTQQQKIDILALQNLLLSIRRHEKDYLMRGEDKYVERLSDTRDAFLEALSESSLSGAEQDTMTTLLDEYFGHFLSLVDRTENYKQAVAAFAAQERELSTLTDTESTEVQEDLERIRTEVTAETDLLNGVFAGVLAASAIIVLIAVLLISGGLFRSLRRLQSAMQQVAEGNLEARAAMTTRDELGQLGNTFDSMLDERLVSLAEQAKENEQLNDSVINLMDAADRLSQRDLTVQVPVSEDITGNVSDALNMMTQRTAATMGEINGLAAQLEQAALAVQKQGEKVAQVAATERQVVDQALASLGQSAETMNEMAQLAASSNELADNTSTSTKRALGAVRNTVQNMNAIRNTVSETEKSIKRLGERSQEIGAIVEIIKDISERTHTLALNAGMQAVAAGEAGRGFSVVADEVQRLAETARESTAQIATLVQSIQAESSETMATMNKTIGQVVEGSELAERSGKRMRVTQKATLELVSAVQQIAQRSTSLVETNEALRGQAAQLRQSTQATEQELEGQAQQTRGMFTYLQNLVAAVRVFKLPEAAKVEQPVNVEATPETIVTEDAVGTEKAA